MNTIRERPVGCLGWGWSCNSYFVQNIAQMIQSKVVVNFFFQGSLMIFYHQKADLIIYLQKHPIKEDLLVAF